MKIMGVYFEICQVCRNHGHFVFPEDGSRSFEVMSQTDAAELANKLRHSGDLPDEDVDSVFREIRRSGLPLFTSTEVLMFLAMEGRTEDLMRDDPIIHPDKESVGRQCIPEIEIPEEVCSFCQELLTASRPQLQ